MKRTDLIRRLEQEGCQPVPRHREINEHLARHILRKLHN